MSKQVNPAGRGQPFGQHPLPPRPQPTPQPTPHAIQQSVWKGHSRYSTGGKNDMQRGTTSLLQVIWFAGLVECHVIWLSPPARQNIGQTRPECRLPVDYDESSTYCGGFGIQHNAANRGRCSICGDEYSAPVKPHQAGGQFATGTLAASYSPGQQVEVTVNLAANHRGCFTFAVGPHNDPTTAPSPDCFKQYPLQVEGGGRYFPASPGTGIKKMTISLPAGLTCSQCVLQMTYTTGNNWGVGAQSAEVQTEACLTDPTGRLGCGPQETFRGCADICIGVGDFCPRGPCAKARVGPPGPAPATTMATPVPATTRAPVPFTTRAPVPATTRVPVPATKRVPVPASTRAPVPATTRAPVPAATRAPVPATSPAAAAAAVTTTMVPTFVPMPATRAPSVGEVCRSAGIKQEFYSVAGDAYCRSYCLNRRRAACLAGPNTAYLCYCNL